MIRKRTLILTGIAASAALLSSGLAVKNSFAADTANPNDTLIEKLASKFNLNKDEVKAVFTEEKEARHTEMQQRAEERLNAAVTAGTITPEQKELIVTKMTEMKSKMEALQGSESTDKRAEMKALHDELKTWAEENDIDFKWIQDAGGPGGRGHGGPKGFDGPPPGDETQAK